MAANANPKIEKAERLLNLTMALLDAKRPLSKLQIFETVAGYSGKSDSMERMFERDKDELREIGIEVKVLPIDAYFDDEIGYRIIPEDYFLPPITFTQQESVWLTLAANVIREFSPKREAKSAVQKLLSRSEVDLEGLLEVNLLGELDIPINNSLEVIWRSIKAETNIQFSYEKPGLEENRLVSPYVLTTRFGKWYVLAEDLKENKIKTFRVDRMKYVENSLDTEFVRNVESNPIESHLKSFYGEAIPEVQITVDVHLPEDHRLFKNASHVETREDCKIITIKKVDAVSLKEIILWSIEHVTAIKPQYFADEIYSGIEKVMVANS
jgi:proteasome accessory factor B